MVGATGFEPATSWSQTKCSSQAELRSDYWYHPMIFGVSNINMVAMQIRLAGGRKLVGRPANSSPRQALWDFFAGVEGLG